MGVKGVSTGGNVTNLCRAINSQLSIKRLEWQIGDCLLPAGGHSKHSLIASQHNISLAQKSRLRMPTFCKSHTKKDI